VVGGLAPHATSGGHSPPAGRRPPVPPTSAAGPIRRPTSLCVSPGASRRAWPPQACCASTARDWRGVARGVETDGSGREEHDRDLITAGGGVGGAPPAFFTIKPPPSSSSLPPHGLDRICAAAATEEARPR
jgi:hypothetical protein